MQVMAVAAGRGILVAGRHGLAVNGVAVNSLLVMALDALGDNVLLVVHPWFVRMDVGVAVGAHDPFGYMDAQIVLGRLFLVTALAANLPDFHLALHMFGDIGYLHVAAGTGILAVDGSGELGNGYLVAVTTEAGGRIDGHSLLCCGKTGKREEQEEDGNEAGNQLHKKSPEIKINPDSKAKRQMYKKSIH